jgi:fructose-1,6-bisphosphatase I
MSNRRVFADKIVTIERYLQEQQKEYPEATGVLTNLLYDMALSAKIIASHTTRAGLAEILGSTGRENIQGEVVQKLDEFAELTIYRLHDHTGRLAVMASEEEEEIIPIPAPYGTGKYVLIYDPLDGSSNIDCNVSVGTIFAIHRRLSEDGPGTARASTVLPWTRVWGSFCFRTPTFASPASQSITASTRATSHAGLRACSATPLG